MVVLHVRSLGRRRTIQIQWFECATEVEEKTEEEGNCCDGGESAAEAWTRKMRKRRNRGVTYRSSAGLWHDPT